MGAVLNNGSSPWQEGRESYCKLEVGYDEAQEPSFAFSRKTQRCFLQLASSDPSSESSWTALMKEEGRVLGPHSGCGFGV